MRPAAAAASSAPAVRRGPLTAAVRLRGRWIQLPAKGQAVGLSDTVRVTPRGGGSVFSPEPPREIALIRPPPRTPTSPYGPDTAAAVRAFFAHHQPEGPTPLASLPKLAAALGLGAVLVKDEAHRLGTSAFKVSGAAYAVAEHVDRGTERHGRLRVRAGMLALDEDAHPRRR